jgi:regulator of replication initiation timing
MSGNAKEVLRMFCSTPKADGLQQAILDLLKENAELEAKLSKAREALGDIAAASQYPKIAKYADDTIAALEVDG